VNADPWRLPCRDELLSSWLARVAVHSGCDPLTLTGAIWPKWRIWTTDLDRGLTEQRAMQAAQWFDCGPEVVHAATLEDLRARLHGNTEQHRPVLPWIISMGSRNRLRYAGMPCCPQCLLCDTQPFFRRTWRLAFVVGCEVHGVRLIDRCSGCRALIAPHRCIAKLQSLACCAVCGLDIRRQSSEAVNADALEFQRIAMGVLIADEGMWGSSIVSGVEWFRRLRRLATPSRCTATRSSGGEAELRQSDLQLELQAPREREARFCNLVTFLRQGRMPEGRLLARHRGTGCVRDRTVEKMPMPVAKELVQADWVRWLRRNRLW
jgi:hypothetical protein